MMETNKDDLENADRTLENTTTTASTRVRRMQNKMRLSLHLTYYGIDVIFYGSCLVVGSYYFSQGQKLCPPGIPLFLMSLGLINVTVGACRCFCFALTFIILFVFNLSMMIFGGIVVLGNYYMWDAAGAPKKDEEKDGHEFCHGVPYIMGFTVEVLLIAWVTVVFIGGFFYVEYRRRRHLAEVEAKLRSSTTSNSQAMLGWQIVEVIESKEQRERNARAKAKKATEQRGGKEGVSVPGSAVKSESSKFRHLVSGKRPSKKKLLDSDDLKAEPQGIVAEDQT